MPTSPTLPARAATEPFSLLRRDPDSLFEVFFRANGWNAQQNGAWLPSFNVSDNVESLRITADLPGLERKDVTVSLDDDRIVISGTRVDEKEEKGRSWYRRERTSGEFRREVLLPYDVDANKASAAMHNGVLTVELPKRPESAQKRRVLEVKQG
jgi:HSP20 family protein